MKRRVLKAKNNLHMLMLLPACLLFFVFFLFPIMQGALFSFTNWDGFGRMDFVGLHNFIRFFSDRRALNALVNSLIYGVAGALTLNLFGLVYALILDAGLKGSGIVRTLVYLPNIISPLIMGYIWVLILSSEGGVLKQTLEGLGIAFLYQDWLADPTAAIVLIIIINLWQSIGGDMMIYIAGLQTISESVHEAALVDGAGWLRELIWVRLPLLGPSIRVNLITNIIGCMSIFDIVMSLTGGGPGFFTESLSVFIYRQSASGSAGYSAAIAMLLFIIILIPVSVSFLATRRLEENY